MKKAKITKSNHINLLWGIPVYGITFICCLFFYRSRISEENFKWLLFLIFFAFLIFFIPHLLLHLKYYLLNRNEELKLVRKKSLTYKFKDGSKYDFDVENIKSVRLFLSPFLKYNAFHMLPWSGYKYWAIDFDDGSRLWITNLMCGNYDLLIPSIDIEERLDFYPWPWMSQNVSPQNKS
ncbi:MAG: hypothetical protein MI748_03155 [Opitutales bacterium]|nr:hypothetical protein [Opitutales bacterium]